MHVSLRRSEIAMPGEFSDCHRHCTDIAIYNRTYAAKYAARCCGTLPRQPTFARRSVM
jgi:hypothetical protein